jgi:hypothetical protein
MLRSCFLPKKQAFYEHARDACKPALESHRIKRASATIRAARRKMNHRACSFAARGSHRAPRFVECGFAAQGASCKAFLLVAN